MEGTQPAWRLSGLSPSARCQVLWRRGQECRLPPPENQRPADKNRSHTSGSPNFRGSGVGPARCSLRAGLAPPRAPRPLEGAPGSPGERSSELLLPGGGMETGGGRWGG